MNDLPICCVEFTWPVKDQDADPFTRVLLLLYALGTQVVAEIRMWLAPFLHSCLVTTNC